MRLLFLTHSFNSLAQRLYVELAARGHEIAIELDINEATTLEAIQRWEPEILLAPFLKRLLPASIWQKLPCWIVHPGIVGDRGPSSLDWALMEGETRWGVTVLVANAEADAGAVLASAGFPLRPATKSEIYRQEVADAACHAVLAAIEQHEGGALVPRSLDPADLRGGTQRSGMPELPTVRAEVSKHELLRSAWPGVHKESDDPSIPQDERDFLDAGLSAQPLSVRGRLRAAMRQQDRQLDWSVDDTATVLRHLRAADSSPGVRDRLFEREWFLFGGHEEASLRGAPGALIARRGDAVCRATVDGAVWITHLQPVERPSLKLPAARHLGERLSGVPEVSAPLHAPQPLLPTYRELRYEEHGEVGLLHFDFYNGAMSTAQCRSLLSAYRFALARPTRVIVLMGGDAFWSNGIHLHEIEASESPADASWENIQAIDDLTLAVIETHTHLTVAAMRGNAAAGGVFLALAADQVIARAGIVLNPHYQAMGNLYGSEYWTYLLPRRVGAERAEAIAGLKLPIGPAQALELGMIDAVLPAADCERHVLAHAQQLAARADLGSLLEAKAARRASDEATRPLSAYREAELARMRLNFYGFDPSYHIARYQFVHRVAHSRTPSHLAPHRARPAPRRP